MAKQERAHWLRKGALVLLACYWLALFTATHLPEAHIPFGPAPPDKALHLMAYFGLAVLASINWASRWPLTGRNWLIVIAILCVYGALDEISQPPFNRHASVYDWFADVGGAIIGASLVTGAVVLRRNRQQPAAQAEHDQAALDRQ